MPARPRDRKDDRRNREPDQPANLPDALAALLLAPFNLSARLQATSVPCSPGNARATPASVRGTGWAEEGTGLRR